MLVEECGDYGVRGLQRVGIVECRDCGVRGCGLRGLRSKEVVAHGVAACGGCGVRSVGL